MTRILIVKEKHSTHFYDVSTDKRLCQVALLILTERNEEGCWYSEPGDPPTPPDFPESTIDTLPASMQKSAREQWKRYHEQLADHQHEKSEYDEIQRVVRDQDGPGAWNILSSRSRYEYENVELEHCTDADLPEIKWPPLEVGTEVVTARKSHTSRHEAEELGMPPDLIAGRRWLAKGFIDGFRDTSGLWYKVLHEGGGAACYRTSELHVKRQD